MFCYMCGKKVIDGARFCPYCGTKLVEIEDASPQPRVDSKSGDEPGKYTANTRNVQEQSTAKPAEVVPIQLLKEDSIVPAGNEFWAFNTSGNSAVNRIKINCIYEEYGTWHVVEKKESFVRGATFTEPSPLMAVDGKACFFAECGNENNNKYKELFVTCRRKGENIEFDTNEIEDARNIKIPDLHSAVVQGGRIYGFGKPTNKGQSFCFDTVSREMTWAKVPIPKFHSEFDSLNSLTSIYALDAYFYNSYVYTFIKGIQSCMLRFPLGNVSDIEHVSLIDAETNLPSTGKFILGDSALVYKNTMYNYEGNFYALNLDTMVFTLIYKGEVRMKGKIANHLLLTQQSQNYSSVYRIFDLEQKQWFKLPDDFFKIKKNGDDVSVKYVTYNGSTVIFSYTKGTDRTFYSVMSLSDVANPNARLVDFTVK